MIRQESRLGALGRVINRPLLATPELVRQFVGVLSSRAGQSFTMFDPITESEEPLATAVGVSNYAENKLFPTVPGTGIAVIDICGTLVHKSGYVGAWCGLTGYDGLETQLDAAMNDDTVRGILIDAHSGGGEVNGCFDLADKFRAARELKPIWAVVDEMAYSAAFAIVSQATEVYMPRTGGIGSVGVVWAHVDWSVALNNDGIKVTLVHAGTHKVDGNPYEPLAAAVRADVQKEVEEVRTLFANIVAQGCGISVADVLATEAACLSAEAAKSAGFINDIMPARDVYAAFAEHLSNSGSSAVSSAARAAIA